MAGRCSCLSPFGFRDGLFALTPVEGRLAIGQQVQLD